jgi:glycosyltransferase involved in cell wall biosynthesis
MLDYQLTEQHHIDSQDLHLAAAKSEPTIAILHCYDLIEDFADTLGLSLERFCKEWCSNWMFGYAKALKPLGIGTVIFYISGRVTETTYFTNQPSGFKICVLPASGIYHAYRSVRHQALKFYGGSEGQSFKNIPDSNQTRRSLLTKVKDFTKSIGSYLSTPLTILARQLEKENCCAILCQEYEFARFDTCVLLGKLLGLPVFASFQGGDETQSLLEKLLRPIAFRACTGVIVAPQTEIQRLETYYGMPAAKIARIFNPIDTTIWRASDRNQARAEIGIPVDAKVVVCHGRIEIERKGLDVLLDAWAQICRERPDQDLRLLLVGTGSDANKLRHLIPAMELRGVIWRDEFVNDRTIIQRYLSAADVYTLPSRLEGFPIAPTEAMACSLPVVAADANGVPDILEDQEKSGGLIVPRGDARALALALGQILDDDVWRHELGKRARQRVEEYFSPEAIGQQLYDFLRQQHKSTTETYLTSAARF